MRVELYSLSLMGCDPKEKKMVDKKHIDNYVNQRGEPTVSNPAEAVVSGNSTIIDKLLCCIKEGQSSCDSYVLIDVVGSRETTGYETCEDSSNDYYKHKFVDQYQISEDSCHGFEYIPVLNGRGTYFKFEFYC